MATTDLEIAAPDGQLVFTQEHRQLMAESIAPGANPAEIEVFLIQCANVQLDPFRNQIWLVGRYDRDAGRKVFKSQTGIDGFRVVAQRSGKYRGVSDPQWMDVAGEWHDVWRFEGKPVAARVYVEHADFKNPVRGLVHWAEFVQTKKDGYPTRMWEEKGVHMLAKCAEALAYRRAFPHDMAGLYISEEMPEAVEIERSAPPDPSVKAVFDRFMPKVQQISDVDGFKEWAREQIGLRDLGTFDKFVPSDMTNDQAEMMIVLADEWLASAGKADPEPVEVVVVDVDPPDDGVHVEKTTTEILAEQIAKPTLVEFAQSMGGVDPKFGRMNRTELLTWAVETLGEPVETVAAHIIDWAGAQ